MDSDREVSIDGEGYSTEINCPGIAMHECGDWKKLGRKIDPQEHTVQHPSQPSSDWLQVLGKEILSETK